MKKLIFTLYMIASISSCFATIKISSKALQLSFDSDGKVTEVRSKVGGENHLAPNRPSGFFATLEQGEKERTVLLTVKSYKKDILTIGSSSLTIKLKVKKQARYMTFKIIEVNESKTSRLLRLEFKIQSKRKLRMIELDWMTQSHHQGYTSLVKWDWIWGRNKKNPIGSFAIYMPSNNVDEDETLLHIWANEGLPHPKTKGDWTVLKAKSWLNRWQKKFSDQSTMIIQADTPQQLYKLTDYAKKLEMKKIYLHTDAWRGEYWPRNNSFLHINRKLFPKGDADFLKYSKYCRSKEMNLAIHIVSCSIGTFDPDYVLGKPDPRLASWCKGTLVKRISDKDKTILFKPEKGTVYPETTTHGWFGPKFVRSYMHTKVIQIGNEFIHVGKFENTDKDTWTLKQCQRGFYKTKAQNYSGETPIKGMYTAYGQAFVADCDSSLLDEVAKRYSNFCNRFGVTHMECDGQEIHQDRPWGTNKFSWKVYENLDHPVTSNSSNGRPLKFQIEYWFNSSQNAKNNHTTGGVAGGDGIPMFLQHEDRVATGPYEILLKPTERIGLGGSTFNLMRPIPMFGVSEHVLKTHGLSPYIAEMIKNWRLVAKQITPAQRKQVFSHFSHYNSFTSPFNEARNQRTTNVVYRPERSGNKLTISPIRLMKREKGDISWGWGQEFGPIVPRQYLTLGQTITVNNPYESQTPEVLIRVMNALTETDGKKIARIGSSKKDSNQDIIDSYETGSGQSKFCSKKEKAATNRVNSLMPKNEKTLTLKQTNDTAKPILSPDGPKSWPLNLSMLGARGIALTVTGDGSNAMLCVTIGARRGMRDYVVPIDFTGTREIVIPSGEVAWSDGLWAWRSCTGHMHYGHINKVTVGLGIVPPKTKSTVKIENLRILKEVPTKLVNPTISIGSGTLKIVGDVLSNQYIWYTGGNSVGIYDENWNKLSKLKVINRSFKASKGSSTIKVCSENQTDYSPWLECQFVVKGKPIVIQTVK